jgi:predicted nucleic acid-binding protein
MTVFLPDTNVLVDALNDKRGCRKLLRDLVFQGNRFACCAVTVAEIYAGMRPHEAARTDQFLASLVWCDTSRGIARHAGRLRFDWARQGGTLSLADTLLAATALEHSLTPMTRNQKHFPMKELSLFPLPGETA